MAVKLLCDAKRATLWCTYNLEGTKCNYGAPGRQKGRLVIEHEIWFPKMDQPLCSHAMRDKRKYFMTLIQHAQYLQAGYQGANQWLVCKVCFLKRL